MLCRRGVAGLDAGRHRAVHLRAKALGKGAGAVILVPVERLGQEKTLRQRQADAVDIAAMPEALVRPTTRAGPADRLAFPRWLE